MKALAIRADRLALDVMTQFVRRWVAWHEYKKHKIDFMIRFEYVQLGALLVWGMAIPAVLWAVEGDPLAGGVHAAVWSLLAGLEWFGIQMTVYRKKPAHDYLFRLREDPSYNKLHAELLEQLFVENRRSRIEGHAFLIGLAGGLFVLSWAMGITTPDSFVWQYLLANALANCAKAYIPYVNDFDPPKKKKKASEAISELLQRLWGELVGGFAPMPVPAPAFQIIRNNSTQ